MARSESGSAAPPTWLGTPRGPRAGRAGAAAGSPALRASGSLDQGQQVLSSGSELRHDPVGRCCHRRFEAPTRGRCGYPTRRRPRWRRSWRKRSALLAFSRFAVSSSPITTQRSACSVRRSSDFVTILPAESTRTSPATAELRSGTEANRARAPRQHCPAQLNRAVLRQPAPRRAWRVVAVPSLPARERCSRAIPLAPSAAWSVFSRVLGLYGRWTLAALRGVEPRRRCPTWAGC